MAFIVYVAHHRKVAHNSDARRIFWHEHHALLAVPFWSVGIRLAHYGKNFAVFARSPLWPPHAAVEHIFVALALYRELGVGSIRTGHVLIGHGVRLAYLSVQQPP